MQPLGYCCYLIDELGRTKDMVHFASPSLREARAKARQLAADRQFPHFELWQGSRLLHHSGLVE